MCVSRIIGSIERPVSERSRLLNDRARVRVKVALWPHCARRRPAQVDPLLPIDPWEVRRQLLESTGRSSGGFVRFSTIPKRHHARRQCE